MTSSAILAELVSFPSISSRSNRDIAAFIAARLRARGVEAELLGSGDKVNLFATLGPKCDGGIILSGHLDVVPVTGQDWTSDPFRLRESGDLLYGRGTADMKGFVACVLGLVDRLQPARLTAPIHICFSHDEEIGCVGVRPILADLVRRGLRPRFCIVGEPTGMGVVTGHKGKLAAVAACRGVAGHSALAPRALNAIHLAADFVDLLRKRQAVLAGSGARDEAYDIPYSTVHAGLIQGGTALNIVPDRCRVDFEIRTIVADDADTQLAAIAAEARCLVASAQVRFPQAGIAIETVNSYPGLETSATDAVVDFAKGLVESSLTSKVAFGTEGGLFAATLGVPTVVCGPGSMDQGHTPDEFIARDQLDRCDTALDRLAVALSR